ncbi:acetyl-CoA carboxylase biotin carboxylase subunit [Oscillibacter valericigenes]|uniref:acetyl-CoA carboxylase biotin carboxylase subunit n=1 Tax=Oscillibacter valericigenes TaxID=351091 RepID=UPI001F25C595|nr:acetyl-CoA carboxylase biotin carboxylase subunit [Oscillibacter valericigenes]MCF2617271.1 acetyl-CoA carboxylase biotin carboxylase subunit [Oscillibacter valericigenes]
MLKRVLIANRGEIALRVLRACRELDIETVAVYSTADAEALHVQLATQSVCIGPAKAADSYLNRDALLTVARATGCDGLHPGYGFLSENADFADACARAGVTFIGPSGDAIRKAGSKSAARELMKAAGVPVTPGSDGPVSSVEDVLAAAERVGYPVLLKASAGGGGRGIRRCDSAADLPSAYAEAKAEAKACFGDDEMYLEKLVLRPRHIEFQILADRQGHVIHLGDRDCSVQRRNQKLIEEAPARCLSPQLRQAMGEAAVRAARAVGYEGAGTVEFLLDSDGEHFYFMEMNTRIQVEHGVTELVTGVDLVRQQLRVASGLSLDIAQEDVRLTGHAIECRVNAEDPAAGFRPCPGKVEFLHFPGGAGVRVDSALYNGCTLSPYYDSLAAKLMVHAPTRLEAIRKMRRCLEEFALEGFPTNAELSYEILFHPTFVRGGCTTAFLDESLPELLDFSRRAGEQDGDA